MNKKHQVVVFLALIIFCNKYQECFGGDLENSSLKTVPSLQSICLQKIKSASVSELAQMSFNSSGNSNTYAFLQEVIDSVVACDNTAISNSADDRQEYLIFGRELQDFYIKKIEGEKCMVWLSTGKRNDIVNSLIGYRWLRKVPKEGAFSYCQYVELTQIRPFKDGTWRACGVSHAYRFNNFLKIVMPDFRKLPQQLLLNIEAFSKEPMYKRFLMNPAGTTLAVVQSIVFSVELKMVRSICLFDTETRKLQKRLLPFAVGSDVPEFCDYKNMKFSDSGQYLLATKKDDVTAVWDLQKDTYQQFHSVRPIETMTFCDEEKWFLVGREDESQTDEIGKKHWVKCLEIRDTDSLDVKETLSLPIPKKESEESAPSIAVSAISPCKQWIVVSIKGHAAYCINKKTKRIFVVGDEEIGSSKFVDIGNSNELVFLNYKAPSTEYGISKIVMNTIDCSLLQLRHDFPLAYLYMYHKNKRSDSDSSEKGQLLYNAVTLFKEKIESGIKKGEA